MRTTVNLDESLVEHARRLTGLDERTALIHERTARADRSRECAPARTAGRKRGEASFRAAQATSSEVILADTSVWVEHLRHGLRSLSVALDYEQVLMHPFDVGELACVNLRNRSELLDLLGRLPFAASVTDAEALAFIETRRLMGRGIGSVDVHLLASTSLSTTGRLWTHDRRLAGVAAKLGLEHRVLS